MSEDFTMQLFGKLLVVRHIEGRVWHCLCACGTWEAGTTADLLSGRHENICDCKLPSSRQRVPAGRTPNDDGYVMVYVPRRGQVLEHRLVMGSIMGRHLETHEHVHHRNRIRDDNRPKNLEMWLTGNHPAGGRVEDLLAHADEIQRKYGSEKAAPAAAVATAPTSTDVNTQAVFDIYTPVARSVAEERASEAASWARQDEAGRRPWLPQDLHHPAGNVACPSCGSPPGLGCKDPEDGWIRRHHGLAEDFCTARVTINRVCSYCNAVSGQPCRDEKGRRLDAEYPSPWSYHDDRIEAAE